MKKILTKFWFFALSAFLFCAFAPKAADSNIFVTRTGHIWFFSQAPLENIEAHNRQASSSLNITTGEMAFQVLIKGFEFEKALMQEHFNENYLESTKFPKATFKGKISDLKKVRFNKVGTYNIDVEGELTIHGVTKQITAPATIVVSKDGIQATSIFKVALKDYNVAIPSLVKDKIAEVVDVNVNMLYKAK
ncbi:MAG: YceI family protein [Sphingobacteriales bacterium]|nr:MAG: YceI family protein [Sphingobacteriales bacterium]